MATGKYPRKPRTKGPTVGCPECPQQVAASYLMTHGWRAHGIKAKEWRAKHGGPPSKRQGVKEVAAAVEAQRLTLQPAPGYGFPKLKGETNVWVASDADGGLYIVEKIR